MSAEVILVVDDNEDNREILSQRLRPKGYAVLEARDGREALAIVERETVDLILLDIMMPVVSGLDVLRTLRQKHPAAELPVIMVTAKSDSQGVVEALELGANDYVTKPIDYAVVLARMQAQLRTRAQRQQLGSAPASPQDVAPARSSPTSTAWS